MKTKILSLLLLLACGQAVGQQRYTVVGTLPVDSCDGKYVVLSRDYAYRVPADYEIDSARIDKGRFRFKGYVDEPFLAKLQIGTSSMRRPTVLFVIEPGTIRIDFDDIGLSGRVRGTPINDDYNSEIILPMQAVRRVDTLSRKRMDGLVAGTWTTDDEGRYLRSIRHDLRDTVRRHEILFLEKYARYPAVVGNMLFDYILAGDTASVVRVTARLPPPVLDGLYRDKEAVERESAELTRRRGSDFVRPKEVLPEGARAGDRYTDFGGVAPDGSEVMLSEIVRGKKLALVDFWASWCVPCLREMPFMAELYDRYKDEGFVVVGVSLDQSGEAWKTALEQHGIMVWPQLRSGEAGEIYKV